MNYERLTQILLAPHVSEKGTAAADRLNQHVFRVLPDASKLEIRKAVEVLFNVKVTVVRTVNVRGKVKRFGRHTGHRRGWKKAYIGLAPGHDINLMGGE